MTGSGVAAKDGDKKGGGDRGGGDGRRWRKCQGRLSWSRQRKRGRDGDSRSEVAEDLNALSDSEITNGKDVVEEQRADGDHGRGLVNNGEDRDGEDGRRSLQRERREEVEQRSGGAGERRPWKGKKREVVGFNNPATAAERDGKG